MGIPASLRRIAMDGHIGAQCLSAQLGGGRVEEDSTARRVMFTQPELRPDWVWPGSHDGRAWDAASTFIRASRDAARPCLLLVDDAADAAREDEIVHEHSLAASGTDRVMVLPDLELADSTPPDVQLDVVDTEHTHRLFVQTAADIFGAPAALFEILYPRGLLQSDAVHAAVARVGGEVVGVGGAYVVEGAVGVYGIATAPRFRRRGIGEALTAWACREGARWGARMAYLQPSEMGVSLYRRMGFRDVGGYRKYVTR